MIIRSRSVKASDPGQCVAAWQSIDEIQKAQSDEYWLVTQPDHAQLSGEIAAAFDSKRFPLITPEVVEAIRVHDDGWAQFEGRAESLKPAASRNGKPLTFLDAAPETFLKAWSGSIRAASETGPTGHYIVSSHFRFLAEHRLKATVDPPETAQRLLDFAAREAAREQELLEQTGHSECELRELLAVLQFCDLASLAVCANVQACVEFPQDFGAGKVRMLREGDSFRLEPSPVRGTSFEFPAFQFGQKSLKAEFISMTLS